MTRIPSPTSRPIPQNQRESTQSIPLTLESTINSTYSAAPYQSTSPWNLRMQMTACYRPQPNTLLEGIGWWAVMGAGRICFRDVHEALPSMNTGQQIHDGESGSGSGSDFALWGPVVVGQERVLHHPPHRLGPPPPNPPNPPNPPDPLNPPSRYHPAPTNNQLNPISRNPLISTTRVTINIIGSQELRFQVKERHLPRSNRLPPSPLLYHLL